MTPTNTTDVPATSPPDFTIPDTVQALLDEASVPGGPYSATFTERAVVLVRADSGTFVRKVDWEHAGQFSRNLLSHVFGAPTLTPTATTAATTAAAATPSAMAVS